MSRAFEDAVAQVRALGEEHQDMAALVLRRYLSVAHAGACAGSAREPLDPVERWRRRANEPPIGMGRWW